MSFPLWKVSTSGSQPKVLHHILHCVYCVRAEVCIHMGSQAQVKWANCGKVAVESKILGFYQCLGVKQNSWTINLLQLFTTKVVGLNEVISVLECSNIKSTTLFSRLFAFWGAHLILSFILWDLRANTCRSPCDIHWVCSNRVKTPKEDPFEVLCWWKKHAKMFPNLALIAQKCAQHPKAASERDFYSSGFVIQEQQNQGLWIILFFSTVTLWAINCQHSE